MDDQVYLYDGRGSVSGVATDTSELVTYAYTAYGELLPDSPEPKAFGYNAEDTDYNTGLQYLRARYYNTKTGRFIQKDAYRGDFSQPGTLNRYVYCAGNPVNRIDPSGYLPTEADLKAAEKAYNDSVEEKDKALASYQDIEKARDSLSSFYDWISVEFKKAQRAYRNLYYDDIYRTWGCPPGALSEAMKKVVGIGKTYNSTFALLHNSKTCYKIKKDDYEKSREDLKKAERYYNDTLEFYKRNEIYDRMTNMSQYKGKKSEALGILKTILEGVNTLGRSTTELMIQYALQFTGNEEREDKFRDIERHEQLPYDWHSGNSFDKYDD